MRFFLLIASFFIATKSKVTPPPLTTVSTVIQTTNYTSCIGSWTSSTGWTICKKQIFNFYSNCVSKHKHLDLIL